MSDDGGLQYWQTVGQNEERQMGKVFSAINKIQSALCKDGITKNHRNSQQGYSFRGIDDVYNALSPLLAEHGVCILPRILDRQCVERVTAKGSALFYVTVVAEFDIVCSEDGSRYTVRTYGEAMDSADKATNKAMSAAYKYAAMQTFAIPTIGDNDADSTTHEVAPQRITPTGGSWESLSDEDRSRLQFIADGVRAELNQVSAASAIKMLEDEDLDADSKIALWTRFDSKERSAMKKAAQESKQAEQQ
jgi:hypothetical protein